MAKKKAPPAPLVSKKGPGPQPFPPFAKGGKGKGAVKKK